MDKRLQFLHHGSQFSTREDAIQYALTEINRGYFSLYAEPIVMKYGEDTENPHVILGIGAATNDSGIISNNKVCFIDVAKTDEEIEELWEAIERLKMVVLDTDTVDLNIDESGEHPVLSANVKVPENRIFDGVVRNNIIIPESDGIYTYVNLEYVEEEEKFIFTINGDSKEIALPKEDYVTGGSYDIRDESLHLLRKGGTDVVIPLGQLIDEWTVEDPSTSPIVLKKEHVVYDEGHEPPYQDILSADVTLSEHEFNIIEKTDGGKSLFVKGTADNIIYFSGNTPTDVQAAINTQAGEIEANAQAISDEAETARNAETVLTNKIGSGFTDDVHDNVTAKFNGLSGSVNTLSQDVSSLSDDVSGALRDIETVSGNVASEIARATQKENELEDAISGLSDAISAEKSRAESAETQIRNSVSALSSETLNAVDALEDADTAIRNDLSSETTRATNAEQALATRLTNVETGLTQESVRAQASENSLNTAINAETLRSQTEDARISGLLTAEVERAQTAENTISGNLASEITRSTAVDDALQSGLNAEIARATAAEQSISAMSVAKTVTVTSTQTVDMQSTSGAGGYNISSNVKVSTDADNIVKVDGTNEGLLAKVDLTYNDVSNKLTLITSNGSKEIPLLGASIIENISYDAGNKQLVIKYIVAGQAGSQTLTVPVGDLFNPVTVSQVTTGAVQLHAETLTGGETELSATLLFSGHEDNLAENDNGALYVPSSSVTKLSSAVTLEIIEPLTGLTDKVANIIEGAGLKQNGEYQPHVGANYINGADSIDDATMLLDVALKTVSEQSKLPDVGVTHSVTMSATTGDTPELLSYVRLAMASGQAGIDDVPIDSTIASQLEDNLLRSLHYNGNDGEQYNGLYFNGSVDYGVIEGAEP